MWSSLFLVALAGGRALAASSVSASVSHSSVSSASSHAASSSATTLSSVPSSTSSSVASTAASSSHSSASSATSSASSVASSAASSSSSVASSLASIYPATSPNSPPPVESPGIVPDFAPAWTVAYQKARAKVAQFSLDEKVSVTTGVGWAIGLCVGNTPPVQDFPGLCLEDSPLGVRFGDFATAFPAGINTAMTWKRSLFRSRGLAMGQEHKGKGVNVALGPMMNLGRVAEGGRNWEGFGADPYLAGEAAFETILGMQEAGVQACAKHYINNEQEIQRTLETSDVDDRTEHELYALPFLRSVMAGVASVMCSYNQVNGTYACENDRTLNQILKTEFGFQGYVMSDWSATHSTQSAVTGLDMTMPGDISFGSGTSYFGANLTAAVADGIIPEERVTDMAERILAAWYLLGQDKNYPAPNFNAFNPLDDATNKHIDVQDDHYKVVREIGDASIVLLKNNGALPLNKPRSLAIIGSDAGPAKLTGPNVAGDQGGVDGILAMGWGSGTANFTYLISPYEALQARARKDHTTFQWSFDDFNHLQAQVVANKKDAAIVFLQSDSGEGYITVDGNPGDRKNLTAWHNGDTLVEAVAARNPNTIVVVHSVGPLIIEPWIDNPNVTAVLWAGLAGTEAGNAVADVLYGDYNPSARLTYTIAKDIADYPAQITRGSGFLTIPYTEGLFIDYRHFDANDIQPRFEFGFGLSYTKFSYSGLRISAIHGQDIDGEEEANWAAGNPTPQAVGTSTALWLHRPAWQVTFRIRNTGRVAGTEIPQLYVKHPESANEPPQILKGFTDVDLEAGQSKTVSLTLSRFDLSIWDVDNQSWVKPNGTFGITIGASSRDPRLNGTLDI
ncbi:beta-glucosidase [Vararia minispora EC-137]|uniref:Beta-glucosidase n=1 Tax=Vararia minispora EC-137 TaxID=1314806 RepID=A0ACB8QS23_9AGAM|nr:beta-glucosidase [Vararia minispora EC-137]